MKKTTHVNVPGGRRRRIPVAGHGGGGVGHGRAPVIAVLQRDDLVAPGVDAGQLDGELRGLAAAVGQVDAAQLLRQGRRQPRRVLVVARVQVDGRRVAELVGLLRHRRHHFPAGDVSFFVSFCFVIHGFVIQNRKAKMTKVRIFNFERRREVDYK